MNLPSCPLMIGISSFQNSTNLVPFLHFQGKKLLLLETDLARESCWSCGIQEVIFRRGRQCTIWPIDSGLEVNKTMAVIREQIDRENGPICWNIGGGQKIQTLPLFITFQERVKKGFPDWLCYSEPQSRTITVLFADGSFQQLVTLVADLSLDDICQTFDYRFENNKHRLLWQRSDATTGTCHEDLLLSNAQLEFFYDYKNRQRMLDYTYQVFHEKQKVEPLPVFNNGPQSLNEYFERVVQTLASRTVAAEPGRHRVNQVWANVTVVSRRRPDDKQEFDLVLVTDFGTLIPLDAKTFEFDKKDQDARTLNLSKVSGFYTDFWSVFPFFRQDIESNDSLLQCNREWKKLLLRPFQVNQRGGKMLVVTEAESTGLALCRKKNNSVSTCSPDTPGALPLIPLPGMLERMQLASCQKPLDS